MWTLSFYLILSGSVSTISGTLPAESLEDCMRLARVKIAEIEERHGEAVLVSIMCHPEVRARKT